MPFIGVNVAIINDGKVLLTKREDFEVWCLPGGAVDERESVAQAGLREAREETGLEVQLTRLVGVYSAPYGPRGGSHIILFAAAPVGGALKTAPGEVIEAGYFSLDELPENLFIGTRREILDALNGVGGGAAWTQNDQWPFDQTVTRWDVYKMRDRSGLSRLQYYQRYFKPEVPEDWHLDLGDASGENDLK